MTIIQTGPETYEMTIRGARMILQRRPSILGNWEMTTINASAKAWGAVNRPGFAPLIMPKYFASLEAVEAKYKSWRGVSKLLAA